MNRTAQNTFRKALTIATTLAAATGAAWAQPELVATVDGTEVASFSQLTFDDTNLGDSSRIVVVLRNDGDEVLEFLETPPVQLSGAFAGQFELIQPALETGGTLSQNGSTAFAIDFAPNVEFNGLNASIFIFTNEQAAPFRLTVRGDGTAPKLEVLQDNNLLAAEDEVNFGEVTVGETAEATFEIKNAGSGPMTVTQAPELAGGLGEFVMSIEGNLDDQIEAGESDTITVKFAPDDARLFTTNLFIRTETADGEELFRLNLVGTGIEAVIEDPADDDGDDQNEDDQNDDDQNEDDDNDNNDDPNDVQDDVIDEPNQPVENEDVDEDEDEVLDPNNADGVDQNEQDEVEDDQQNDDLQDENEYTDHEVEIDPDLVTPLTCGFGAGFASLASMASLGGLTRRKRRIC